MRIVVGGLIASYPLGGLAWHYLGYVRGLQALGHEIVYLEDTGRWVYDPRTRTFTAASDANVRYLASVLGRCAPPPAWAFRDPAGTLHGMEETALARACAEADLLLNVSGACWLREAYRGRGAAAYVDTDPGCSQAVLLAGAAPDAPAALRHSAAMIRAHDVFFTFGESVGRPGCAIPTAGLDWHPTRQPIVLADWPVVPPPAAGAFTTVMSWRTESPTPVLGGRSYRGKEVELRRIVDLPRRTAAPLEIALAGDAPRAELAAAGWRIVDAHDVSATPDSYRDYLAGSRGELAVAKEAYVATASGWFSERSAAYLALGRPVVVQDTGLAAHHPLGEGLLTFTDVEGAAAALAAVASDPARHGRAARALAAEGFDAGRVLRRLLDGLG